jgi:hypothetical protein
MNSSASQGGQLGPLQPGDVVSAALKLYRDRFKAFFQLAFLANLWLFGGLVALIALIAVLAGIFGAIGGDLFAIVGGLIGGSMGLFCAVYGSAKFYLLSSVIGRLSFQDLIQQPETSIDARRRVAPKLGQFLVLGLLLFLAYIGTYIVGLLLALLAGGSVGFVLAGIFSALINATAGNIIGIFIGVILGLLIFLVALIWVVSRLFIAEVVLAIEPNQVASGSMGRSWELTKTAIFRIQIVFLAAFFIQIPIVSVTNYIPSILLEVLPLGVVAYSIVYVLSLLLSIVGSMVVLPFWQAIKGVLYYDLRSRREGLDLELRNPPGDAPA